MPATGVHLRKVIDHVVIHSNSKYNPKLRLHMAGGDTEESMILSFYLPATFIQLFSILTAIQDGSYKEVVHPEASGFAVSVGLYVFIFDKATAEANAEALLPKVKQAALYAYPLGSFQAMLKSVADKHRDHGLPFFSLFSNIPEIKFVPKAKAASADLVTLCQKHLDSGSNAETIVTAILEALKGEKQ